MNKKILKFIKRRKSVVIASVDEAGFPNAKAMNAPRKIEGNTFYFSTNTSSMRVQQFLQNPKASLYFFKRGLFRYTGVMLVGTVQILTDEESKKSIWQRGDTLFYKKGVSDPDYCVLQFTAQSCRYYRDLKTETLPL